MKIQISKQHHPKCMVFCAPNFFFNPNIKWFPSVSPHEMVLEYVEVVPRAEGVPVPPEPRVPQFRPESLAF